ncbi:hypothetical protein ACWEFL_19000 [Streptomyces sp. NPDC004838]
MSDWTPPVPDSVRSGPPGPGPGVPPPGRDTAEVLAAWGVEDAEALLSSGAAVQS